MPRFHAPAGVQLARRLFVFLLTLFVASSWPVSVEAVSGSSSVADYAVESWGRREGLPAGTIWSLAQDSRGYLWLGTDTGLVRFDGFRFQRWDAFSSKSLSDNPIRALLVARTGDLWVGYDNRGGVSVVHDGIPRNYGEKEGLPKAPVAVLLETPDGTMWAGTTGGLYALSGDSWVKWKSNRGLPDDSVSGGYINRQGVLVVATPNGIYERLGSDTFGQIETFDIGSSASHSALTSRAVCEDRNGRMYVTDSLLGFRVIGTPTSTTTHRGQGRGQQVLCDRSGNVWIGTWGEGLWRVDASGGSANAIAGIFTSSTGLAAEGVFSLLEDQNGNLWAGTTDGLTRLTPHRVTRITDLGIVAGVQTTGDGSIWVGTFNGLFQFKSVDKTWHRTNRFLRGQRIRAMYRDSSGGLWVATNKHVLRLVNGQLHDVPGTEGLQQVESITSDTTGAVWLADISRGLARWDRGRVTSVQLPDKIHRGRIIALYGDRHGQVWVGFERGFIAVVDDTGQLRLFGEEQGLDVDSYRVIYEDSVGRVWIGASNGLLRFNAGHFVTAFHAESVKAITEDAHGQLWIGVGSGIVSIVPGDFDSAAANRSSRFESNIYDKSEGVAGTPRWMGDGSSLRAIDGTLWFVTGQGITIVNPQTVRTRSASLPSFIDNVVVDSEKVKPAQHDFLSPGTRAIEIDYSTINLTSPDKTRFRYRLDGFDSTWIEAGTRRQAFYTNLRPREYRFRVLASDDGKWNDAVAAEWGFSVTPRFYQTVWFPLASLLALLTISTGVWRLRLRRLQQRFALLLEERTRLSRELHDTLLQSLVGIALQLESATSDLEAPTTATKEQFLRMRKQVEQYIRDARKSIWNLRSPGIPESDLVTALEETRDQIATASDAPILGFRTTGTPRRYSAQVEQQLVRIGREAIINAMRHAAATHIDVEVCYGNRGVVLRVVDDGTGFDTDMVAHRDGHYGLVSMHERARQLGGTLTIRSAHGQGTAVEVIIPSGLQRQRVPA